jgi:hypothetical protein
MESDIRARIAGIGAILFVAVVVLANVLRGGAPSPGASAEDVLAHYSDNRALIIVLAATFVLNVAALATFLGGTVRRMLGSDRPGWAIAGCVGAAGVVGLFSMVVGSEQALSVVATGDQPDSGAIDALWAIHNSVFSVLYVSIAVALLGLARAGVAAGITPRVFDRIAPVGAALLGIGAIAGPAIAAGDAMPAFGLAGIGFLTWLAFLVTTGIRLIRS